MAKATGGTAMVSKSARKKSASKAAGKTSASKKSTSKKSTSKKSTSTVADKSASKKSASKKSASKAANKKSASTAADKQSASKAAGKKSASKAAGKKSASKKSTSRKSTSTVADKSVSKKSASKAAGKKSTSKATKKSTSEKSASKSPASKSSSTQARSAGAGPRDARATAAAGRAIVWLQRHASLPDLPEGASPAALAKVEGEVGAPLPPDLAAWWALHDGGVPIFEYAGMSCAESLRRRKGLETLRLGGTFNDHELFEQDAPRIAAVKWHTGWIPLAEDGGGNLYLVDTAPGPAGQVGQVLRWEVRGGAFAASSVSLADVLERYADALESGEFVFDPQSLNFDGPFLDLLA